MSVIAEITATSGGNATFAAPPRTAASAPGFRDVMNGFVKEARMTPYQRIRRDVLKDNKLTEEILDAMPPVDRRAIEAKLAPIIAQRVRFAEEEARRQGRQIALPSL